jgi:hypothetical protein
MDQQIERIIQLEYDMFDVVQNENGRASCQDDFPTFKIMRESQFSVWDQATLKSYEHDLKAARAAKINLVAEKYGYMMQETDPEGFSRIADLLQPIEPAKLALIEPICEIHQQWYKAMAAAYPKLVGNGRPLSQADSYPGETSVLTYLRGELLTYSLATLQHYQKMVQHYQAAGINMVREILLATAQHYGYATLEAAENSI